VKHFRIVDTDNFDGDYPDEKWASPVLFSHAVADSIAKILNDHLSGGFAPRYYKIVELPYTLQPGFEP